MNGILFETSPCTASTGWCLEEILVIQSIIDMNQVLTLTFGCLCGMSAGSNW